MMSSWTSLSGFAESAPSLSVKLTSDRGIDVNSRMASGGFRNTVRDSVVENVS